MIIGLALIGFAVWCFWRARRIQRLRQTRATVTRLDDHRRQA